jgi:hypothetical protein
MYAIIVEYVDGTVDTNGPYRDLDHARWAATGIAENLFGDLNPEDWGMERKDDDWVRLESVGDETLDVYVKLMHAPIARPLQDR